MLCMKTPESRDFNATSLWTFTELDFRLSLICAKMRSAAIERGSY